MALTRSSEKLEDLLPSVCGAGRSLYKQQTERGTKEDRGWGASGRPSEEKRRSKVLFWLVPLLLPPLSSLRRSQWGRSIFSRTGQTPTPEKVEELPSPTWKWCWWPYMGTTTHYSEHGLEWSKGRRRGGGKSFCVVWLTGALRGNFSEGWSCYGYQKHCPLSVRQLRTQGEEGPMVGWLLLKGQHVFQGRSTVTKKTHPCQGHQGKELRCPRESTPQKGG